MSKQSPAAVQSVSRPARAQEITSLVSISCVMRVRDSRAGRTGRLQLEGSVARSDVAVHAVMTASLYANSASTARRRRNRHVDHLNAPIDSKRFSDGRVDGCPIVGNHNSHRDHTSQSKHKTTTFDLATFFLMDTITSRETRNIRDTCSYILRVTLISHYVFMNG